MTPLKTKLLKTKFGAFRRAFAVVAAAGSLVAGLSQAAPPIRHENRHEKVRVSAKSLTGLYSRKDGADLSVLARPGSKLEFAIAALGPYFGSGRDQARSDGELYGTVTLRGSRAEYHEGACHVTFRFTGSKAILSQGDSDCDFGAGVDVTGVYDKKNSQTPKPETLTPQN